MRGCRVATLAVLVLWVLGCDALCSVAFAGPMVATVMSSQTSTLVLGSVALSPQNIWSAPDSPPKPAPTLS